MNSIGQHLARAIKAAAPIELEDHVWWVGATLPDDRFQCHAYFIDNGDDSVLIDPGSPLTIRDTLAKIEQIAPLTSIRWLVAHHADPDVIAAVHSLSETLTRDDVEVVTEWRAQALIKHYGHRFGYYLVEEHDWALPLSATRSLEFQLTPYLHFPGAMVSFDTATRTLFSSDLFGGFVPDSDVLESHDLDYVIESARPFHQHYMPSTALLRAGLTRIQRRWPDIARIAPQHGHVIPAELVTPAFEALKDVDCGVFALADADLDLKRLLRVSEARTRLNAALLAVSDLPNLVTALDSVITATQTATGCTLYVEVPDVGWSFWNRSGSGLAPDVPRPADSVELPGSPRAVLVVDWTAADELSDDVLTMLAEMSDHIRPAVDLHLQNAEHDNKLAHLRTASRTDTLTGLRNRRDLEADGPTGDYSLLSIDLDHFKAVNDTFGHPSGDVVLREVAMAIRSSVRGGDLTYRLGGEEILVVLPGADLAVAELIAERTRATVADLDLSGLAPDGQVTLSIGVTTVHGGGPRELGLAIEAADRALYEAKETGRNRVVSGRAADR